MSTVGETKTSYAIASVNKSFIRAVPVPCRSVPHGRPTHRRPQIKTSTDGIPTTDTHGEKSRSQCVCIIFTCPTRANEKLRGALRLQCKHTAKGAPGAELLTRTPYLLTTAISSVERKKVCGIRFTFKDRCLIQSNDQRNALSFKVASFCVELSA